jgi:hypothetical protein
MTKAPEIRADTAYAGRRALEVLADGPQHWASRKDAEEPANGVVENEMLRREAPEVWAQLCCRPNGSINLKATLLERSSSALLQRLEGAIAGCLNDI